MRVLQGYSIKYQYNIQHNKIEPVEDNAMRNGIVGIYILARKSQ